MTPILRRNAPNKQTQIVFTVVLVLLFGSVPFVQAQTFTVLYQFTGAADGASPYRGSLFLDKNGNVFGSAAGGGDTTCNPPFGCGVVFEIDTASSESVLHTFTGSPDGAEPYSGMIVNPAGGEYAVAEYGGTGSCTLGPGGCGAIINIDSTGKETVFYSFSGTPDGATPQPYLIRDAAGNLYGTTGSGGTFNYGTVFKIDPTGKETVLYSFAGSTDGQWPMGGVVRDATGSLYGTTWQGGAYGSGSVFKLTPRGTKTILHSFGLGSDGSYPFAGLARDKAGDLYGTTVSGGAHGYGAVFKIKGKTLHESLLHSFAGNPTDGSYPYAAVVVDPTGNLYGTTWNGGLNDFGTIFKINTAGHETLLHSFQQTDGFQIYGGLVLDARGNLYGTAVFGGAYNQGTVFKLTP